MTRVLSFLTALFLLALPLTAAQIVSVSPSSGSVNGGDVVTITLDAELPSCIVCSPPSNLGGVTFGGVAARSVNAGVGPTRTIVAVTPAHAAGSAALVVTIPDPQTGQSIPFASGSFLFVGHGTPVPAIYEKVLVPELLGAAETLPGAFGSTWTSELWVRNRSAYPVELFHDASCYGCDGTVNDPFPQIAAGSIKRITAPILEGVLISPLPTLKEGILYYVQKGGADSLSFSLHIADISRSSQNAGTELGVIRQSQFRNEFDILNVPIDGHSRATLRLYDTDAIAPAYAPAHVDVLSMDGTPLASTVIPLKPLSGGTTVIAQMPPFAAIGRIDDLRFGTFQTQPVPGGAWPARVRIHVKFDYDAHGWGFVSVTNNDTQLVTTFRPE